MKHSTSSTNYRKLGQILPILSRPVFTQGQTLSSRIVSLQSFSSFLILYAQNFSSNVNLYKNTFHLKQQSHSMIVECITIVVELGNNTCGFHSPQAHQAFLARFTDVQSQKCSMQSFIFSGVNFLSFYEAIWGCSKEGVLFRNKQSTF